MRFVKVVMDTGGEALLSLKCKLVSGLCNSLKIAILLSSNLFYYIGSMEQMVGFDTDGIA